MCIIPASCALSKEFADLITPDDAHPCKGNTLFLYLSFWEFEEGWYLRHYPDLAEAAASGHFASGWRLFASVGFFDGRLPIEPVVDGDWYADRFLPADGRAGSDRRSCRGHFLLFGYSNGATPRATLC